MTSSLTFLDWHRPGLLPGDYTITVKQAIQADSKIPLEQLPPTTRHFAVLGPRFTLDPQEIQEMFPPPGSLGEHANVLPHMILKRSTLPWERSVRPGAGDAPGDIPWLALLLFEEREIQERTLKLRELRTQKDFPDLGPPETGDHDDDHVTVIDVPTSLLQQLIPTAEALKYLAHVRQNTETQEEVAVLIGNRLPTPGGMSIVHLVSLEQRYAGDAFDFPQGATSIPLVSLKSWRFACVSAKQSFKGLLTHLNHQLLFHFPPAVTAPLVTMLNAQQIPEAVRAAFALSARPLTGDATVRERSQWRITDRGNRSYLVSDQLHVFNQAGKQVLKLDAAPNECALSEQPGLVAKFKQAKHTLDEKATIAKPARPDHWWIQDGSRQYFISQEKDTLYVYDLDPDSASTLRLPPLEEVHGVANTVIDTYLKRGSVPLPHAMRQGNQTVSWYHGPFTPGRNTTSKAVPLPVRCADALLRYNQDSGMLDVSYAAAWELGRLLTLQKTPVAIDLFNWKRAHAHDEQLQMAESRLAHLPYELAQTDLALPQTVTQWFADLACLRGVPFAYLVPDERMLPLESIRFFWVDWQWMACLLDGAFSVGRVMRLEHERDQRHVTSTAQGLVQTRHDIVTGVLVRSEVVAGWPGLLVDGYADENDTTPLTLLRMERLAKQVLLCLFACKVTVVDMHQRPETLHFGFNRPAPPDAGADYYKEKTEPVYIDWQDRDKRVVCIKTLAGKLQADHSAQFALEMIEGVEKVRFQLA